VLTPDPEIAQFVASFDARVTPIANRVVGRITADLPNVLEARGSGETAAGDVVADAMLEATRAVGAQVAFVNSGSVRTPLRFADSNGGELPGEITYGEVYATQPFGNSLVTMTLTGAQLEKLLAQQWVGQKSAHMLEVSGNFRYSWDASKPDGSDKVVPGSIRIDGRRIMQAGLYRITVNDFMAAGGDGSLVLLGGADKVIGINDCEAMMAYLAGHSPVGPPPQNRVTRLN